MAKTGKTVKETGISFDPFGILGTSPNGIVDDETVVEIMWLYTERNLTIEQAVKSSGFCLEKSECGQYLSWREIMFIGIRSKVKCTSPKGNFVILLYGVQKILLFQE